jgi:hypothetical protein
MDPSDLDGKPHAPFADPDRLPVAMEPTDANGTTLGHPFDVVVDTD